MLPTVLRSLGVLAPSEEDRTRYPDRTWTIDSGAAPAQPPKYFGAVRQTSTPQAADPASEPGSATPDATGSDSGRSL